MRTSDDRFRFARLHPSATRRLLVAAARSLWSLVRTPPIGLIAGALRWLRRPTSLLALSAVLLTGVVIAAIRIEGWALIWLLMFSPVGIPLITVALQGGASASRQLGLGEPSSPIKRALVRAMLRAQRCPSCDYDLRGSPAQPDGCILCPECGAAWRHARLGRADDPPPEVVVVHP